MSASGADVAELRSLYERHEWFRLRDLASADAPLFYRAAVAVAFRQDEDARRMLREVVRSPQGQWEAGEAKRLQDLIYLQPQLHRRVGKPQVSRLRCRIHLGALYVPMAVNGKPVEYVLDTGAAKSVVSESEARRLGLRLVKAEGTVVDGATGGLLPLRQVGIAAQVRVGNTELRNVIFFVFPDNTFFFQGRPAGENGILGLAAIQALGMIGWDADGSFVVGEPVGSQTERPNLAFDGERLVTEVGLAGEGLVFMLDTGAGESNLWTGFRNRFPQQMAAARKERRTGGGASGVIEYDAMVLPELRLVLGGLETILRPAQVMPQESLGSGYMGNAGLDLLNQAREVRMDFRSMRLMLVGRRGGRDDPPRH